jgi:hypothetical protein
MDQWIDGGWLSREEGDEGGRMSGWEECERD